VAPFPIRSPFKGLHESELESKRMRTIESELLFKVPLLITESPVDFAVLNVALTQEIKPRGTIEQMYVADIAFIVWEILRLRRCKVAIVNTAFKDELRSLVYLLAGRPDDLDGFEREWLNNISLDWWSKPKPRREILKLLKKFDLNGQAIEAEAIRSKLSELEMLDRMLTVLESRRNKALRSIADYREGFADQVRKASNRLIDGGDLIQLEDRSHQRSA
jgi:hypothetical protein